LGSCEKRYLDYDVQEERILPEHNCFLLCGQNPFGAFDFTLDKDRVCTQATVLDLGPLNKEKKVVVPVVRVVSQEEFLKQLTPSMNFSRTKSFLFFGQR